MSADNWGICPKCKLDEIKRIEDLKLKAGEAYGKIPPEEYLELLDEASKTRSYDNTLREDYEVGTDEDGEFSVSYSSFCTCGFKYKYEVKIDLLKDTP
jgi:hypothetical protein